MRCNTCFRVWSQIDVDEERWIFFCHRCKNIYCLDSYCIGENRKWGMCGNCVNIIIEERGNKREIKDMGELGEMREIVQKYKKGEIDAVNSMKQILEILK